MQTQPSARAILPLAPEIPPPFLVLIYTPSWEHAEPLLRTLELAGFDAIVAHVLEEGVDLLIAEQFDAVVVGGDNLDEAMRFLAQAQLVAPETHRMLALKSDLVTSHLHLEGGLVEASVESHQPQEVVHALHRTLVSQARSRRKFVFQERGLT